MENNPLLTADLLKLAGLTEAEAKALVYDEQGQLKQDAPTVFANKVNEKFTRIAEDKLNAGIRMKGEAIEAAVGQFLQKHGVTKASKVEETIAALVQKLEQDAAGKTEAGQLKDEDIVKLPAFQQALDDRLAVLKNEKQSLMTEYETFKNAVLNAEKESVVAATAFDILSAKKAVFSAKPLEQIAIILRGYGLQNVQIQDKQPKLVDANGHPLRDDHQNPVKFEDWIVQVWSQVGPGFNDTNDDPPPAHQRKSNFAIPPGRLTEAVRNADSKDKAKLLREAAAKLRKP